MLKFLYIIFICSTSLQVWGETLNKNDIISMEGVLTPRDLDRKAVSGEIREGAIVNVFGYISIKFKNKSKDIYASTAIYEYKGLELVEYIDGSFFIGIEDIEPYKNCLNKYSEIRARIDIFSGYYILRDIQGVACN